MKKQDDMKHELQAFYPVYYSKVKFYIGDVRNIQSVRDYMTGCGCILHIGDFSIYFIKRELMELFLKDYSFIPEENLCKVYNQIFLFTDNNTKVSVWFRILNFTELDCTV